MEVSQLRFLQTAAGAALLAEADGLYDGANALAVGQRLRRRHDPGAVAAALSQVGLRRRALAKFGEQAAAMFFTSDGLEQATTAPVARHRAGRLAVAPAGRLVDLGCGIGSDLVAFAEHGLAVTGVESSPLTAAVAAANLAVLGLPGAVEVGVAEHVDLDAFDAVFADPARRGPRGRIFDPEAFSPPWSFVVSDVLGAGTASGRVGVVKTAPGIPHHAVPAGVEAEFVSLDGDLREACLWSARLAGVSRRATLLSSVGEIATLSDRDDPGQSPVRPVGRYLYEPDDAVVRAHLVTAAAAVVDGWLLDPHLAYLSSDRRTDTALARCFEVLEVLPYRERQLRAALRRRGIGPLTVKKRGVAVRPEALVRRLGLTGDQPGTLVLSRTPRSAIALLVRPVRASPRQPRNG